MPPTTATIRGFEHDPSGMSNDPMYELTRVFVYFLQNLFREAPEGSGYRWRPEQENTEIVITDQKPRLDAVERVPHITCVLGAGQWAGLGLDQLQNKETMTGSGTRTHTDLVSMTVAYHCQSKEGLHARRIAWYCSYFTNVYRRIIMRYGRLHQVGVVHGISAESSPQTFTGPVAESEIVSVVVTVPFYWQPQWRITDPSYAFRQIRFNMEVMQPQATYSAGRMAPLRGARVNGRPVATVPLEPKPSQFTQIVQDSKYEEEEE